MAWILQALYDLVQRMWWLSRSTRQVQLVNNASKAIRHLYLALQGHAVAKQQSNTVNAISDRTLQSIFPRPALL